MKKRFFEGQEMIEMKAEEVDSIDKFLKDAEDDEKKIIAEKNDAIDIKQDTIKKITEVIERIETAITKINDLKNINADASATRANILRDLSSLKTLFDNKKKSMSAEFKTIFQEFKDILKSLQGFNKDMKDPTYGLRNMERLSSLLQEKANKFNESMSSSPGASSPGSNVWLISFPSSLKPPPLNSPGCDPI
jgi:chromosome segregation ATPase